MMAPIQVVLILFALFALSRAWLRYNEGKIRGTEFSFWLIVWVTAIVAIAMPRTVSFASEYLGIGRPADLIVYAAVILLFYLVFRMYVAVDGMEQKITKIIREIAIRKEKKK